MKSFAVLACPLVAQAGPALRIHAGSGLGLMRAEGVSDSGPILSVGVTRGVASRVDLGLDVTGFWSRSAYAKRAQYSVVLATQVRPTGLGGTLLGVGLGSLYYRTRYPSGLGTGNGWVARVRVGYVWDAVDAFWLEPYIDRGFVLSYSGSGDFWSYWHFGTTISIG